MLSKTLICGLIFLVGCQHYRKPIPSTPIWIEIRGKLQMRSGGIYLATSTGDYKINTNINIWTTKLTMKGIPHTDKYGNVTLDVYEVDR